MKKTLLLATILLCTCNYTFAQFDYSKYTLKYSSETPEEAEAALGTLTDAEKAVCYGDFNSMDAFKQRYTYSLKGGSTWNKYMAETDEDKAKVVKLEDGKLHLLALSKDGTTTGFITGGVRMAGGYKYGLYQIKAHCTPYKSNFPAIWMMPQAGKGGWPMSGEMDIMEQVGNSGTVHSTIHVGARYSSTEGGLPVGKNYTYTGNKTFDGSANEHVYSLLWDMNSITFYCDDSQVFHYDKDKTLDLDANPDYEQSQFPFNYEFALILNQAIGQNSGWGAEDPDPAHTYEMVVDWVRFYDVPQDRSVSNYYTLKNYTDQTRYMSLDSEGKLSAVEVADKNDLTTSQVFSVVPGETHGLYWLQSRANPDLRIDAPTSTAKQTVCSYDGAQFYWLKDDTKGWCFDSKLNEVGKTVAEGSNAVRMNSGKDYIVTAGGSKTDASWWIAEDGTDITKEAPTDIVNVKANGTQAGRSKFVRDEQLIITDGMREFTTTGTRIK